MGRRTRALAFLTIGAVVLSTTAASASTAAGHARIGPNQIFVGRVNGSSGLDGHAQIRVACPGPGTGGTTHPLPHQPLEVDPPAAVAGVHGDTGRYATAVDAYLGIPPTTGAAGGIATFKHYGRAKSIPTTLTVPCSGSGYITFMPVPRDPGTSRAFVVPVDYVNIAT